MKKLNVIITIVIALAIVSCASVEHEKSEAMELVYETDFSSDDGAFKYGDGEVNEIQDGVLHLKKKYSLVKEDLRQQLHNYISDKIR